jgi:hypothetical protein
MGLDFMDSATDGSDSADHAADVIRTVDSLESWDRWIIDRWIGDPDSRDSAFPAPCPRVEPTAKPR